MSLYIATYSASIAGLQPGATPQDIFTIQAAAAKLVQVVYIDIAFTETTAGDVDIFLLKRSTANAAGTAATAVPFDSADPGATAAAQSYTANPTPGTLVGVLLKEKLFGALATAQAVPVIFNFSRAESKLPILRPGSQETLALNLNGITAPAGASFDINVIWTEQ